MSSCDNHYGAQCNFSCATGYRLDGSSKVSCVAPGNQHPGVWNNTLPICEGKVENVTSIKLKLKWSQTNSYTTTIPMPLYSGLLHNRWLTLRQIIIEAITILK